MNSSSVADDDTSSLALTRSLPPSLAPIVAEFELEQAFLITMDDLARISRAAGIGSEPKLIAKRLRDLGWLLPTHTTGVWEFAPGAHAGPIGQRHPFREVKAALAAQPELDVAVCLTSALWAHQLLERAPELPEVAIPVGSSSPRGLARSSRVVRFDRQLPTVMLRGTPVHQPATILAHLATRPADVASWGAILDVLPDLVATTDEADLREELRYRPAAVKTRLAYLIHGVTPDLAHDLAETGHGKVWFGPRGPLRRHHSGFDVADTILPISPALLTPSRSKP